MCIRASLLKLHLMIKSNAEFCASANGSLQRHKRLFSDGGHMQPNPSEELLSWSASGNRLLPHLKDELLLTAFQLLRRINASLTAFRVPSPDHTSPSKKRASTPR